MIETKISSLPAVIAKLLIYRCYAEQQTLACEIAHARVGIGTPYPSDKRAERRNPAYGKNSWVFLPESRYSGLLDNHCR